MRKHIFQAALWFACAAPITAQEPQPLVPLPQPKQVSWQQMETYAFIHFGPNTFNNVEWGYGDADPKQFNPSEFDADQWARTLKNGGMKGVIITAKHHDGFCLWPTKYTDYSIASSPFQGGQGDIVGSLAEACRRHGLRFGVYLSPWDRHQATYGTADYITYYRAQLTELLTLYGPIFEVWFDGANGGDGYYGGARETRQIDRRTYYDFPSLNQLVFSLQPEAIIFSDGGPSCRWVGNEKGVAGTTNWAFLRASEVYPGYPNADELTVGHTDGDTWIPSECDVSIRPGWFYHPEEDGRVKSAAELMELYYKNVGRNGTFLLNIPPMPNGRINPIDSANLAAFHRLRTRTFAHDLLLGARMKASSRATKSHSAELIADTAYAHFWAPRAKDASPTLTITLPKPQEMNVLMLQEYIPMGQRVQSFSVEYSDGRTWQPLPVSEETTTIGYKRLLRFPTTTVSQLRIRFLSSRAVPCINRVGAFRAE